MVNRTFHDRSPYQGYQEKKEGIERQKQQQERKIQGLKKSAEQNREKAERIYENYQTLDRIKRQIEKSLDENGWEKTREKIKESEAEDAEKISTLNKQNEFVSIDTGEGNLKVYLSQDLEATASQYYDKAKNSEKKIENAEQALKDTEKQLEDLEKQDIDTEEVLEDKTQKRKKQWFEKYRWFHTPEGRLVVCGRGPQTNESLVNKHLQGNDLYLHADFDGAPSVALKDGQNASDEEVLQAAKAAVTFSKAWRSGIGADDIYHVKPSQVTKDPESGEYLEKGAFVIRGERTYLRNVSVNASIGPHEIEENTYLPVCGPRKSIEANCEEVLDLKPGRTKKSEIAKKARSRLRDYELDLDYTIRALPPGGSEID